MKDEDWEKKLERITKRKIRSCIKEKGLMDSTDVVMELLFTEEIIA